MKMNSLRGLLFLLILFSGSVVFGQTITGTVTGDNFPLPGVNIAVEGTQKGAVTDFDGLYSIDGVQAGDVLVFSSIGFATKKVTAIGNAVINVNLEEDIKALDEVVVVGYGKQSRAKVSSAITTVGSEKLNDTPVIGVDQALQGKASGVTVTAGGEPGRAPSVRIRGLSTFGGGNPLYIVDGIQLENINSINPNSIASVDVLKDAASAAIYGSRGSNGVIIITTKKGKPGYSKLGVNTYTGFQSFDKRYDLLNSEQYAQYAEAFGAVPARLTDPRFSADAAATDTDWQDQIFRSALQQNIEVNYSGGSDNITYYMSGSYLKQEGVIIGTGFDRYTFNANSDQKLSDKIKIGQNLSVAITEDSQLNESGGRTLIEHAIKQAPVLGVFEPGTDNFQGPSSGVDGNDSENPVRVQDAQDRINNNTNFFGSVYGEYEILKGLSFRQQVGVNLNFNRNDYISRAYADGNYDGTEFTAAHVQLTSPSTDSRSRALTTTLTSNLTYNTTIADLHDLTLTAVYERLDRNQLDLGTAVSDINPDTELFSSSFEEGSVREELFKRKLVSYIGRLNYAYDDKYIVTASIRRDGSSRFGRNNIWGNFPAASAAWRVSQESFMQSIGFISDLKLRASYGVTGNDDIPDYSAQSVFLPFGSYTVGDRVVANNAFTGFVNDDLRWEESIKTNFGIDFGFLNNKLKVTAEYFTSDGKDLLVGEEPAPSFGIPNTTPVDDRPAIQNNIADVRTEGVELTIGYTNNDHEFKWGVDANISTAKNEVITTSSNGSDIFLATFEGEAINVIREGEPILSLFGWETDGLYQSQEEIDSHLDDTSLTAPGDIRFVDQNNDGAIDNDDRTIIGNPFPEFTYAFNLNASYKGFDFLANFYGVQGVDILNTNLYDIEGVERLFNAGTVVLDAWTPTNTNTLQPRVSAGDTNRNVRVSDRYIEDGSFLRVKNITLGYSIPTSTLEGILNGTISKLRIYAQAQNAITFTNYRGYDPEVPARNQNFFLGTGPITEYGVDRGFYPTPKNFLIGLQLEF